MTPEEEWEAILPGLREPEERYNAAAGCVVLLALCVLFWVAIALGVAAVVNR